METVIVRAHSRGTRWDGPLRGWLDNRARQMRDEHGVQAVVIVERRDDDSVFWEIGIRLTEQHGAAALVLRHLIADLEVLQAGPELCTEAELPELRRRSRVRLSVPPDGRPPH